MNDNPSISLGNHFENFMSLIISSGRYSSKQEVIQAGLQLLEEEEMKYKELGKALQEGEESPVVEDYNAEEHLLQIKKKYLK